MGLVFLAYENGWDVRGAARAHFPFGKRNTGGRGDSRTIESKPSSFASFLRISVFTAKSGVRNLSKTVIELVSTRSKPDGPDCLLTAFLPFPRGLW